MIASTGQPASTLMFGLDSDAWDRALIYSLIAAAIATVFVGVSAAGSIITHKRDAAAAEGHLKRYKDAAAQHGVEARADAVAADRAAGPTVEGPGRAQPGAENPHVPRFVREAGAQRSVLETDAGSGAPPVRSPDSDLTPAQATALIGALGTARGNISIDYEGGNREAQPLSGKLQDAFRSAGWNVSSGIILGLANPPDSGILLRVNRSGITALQERVVQALKAARIGFDLRPDRDPRPPGSRHVHAPIGMGVDDVEVVVTGPRP
ncbi:hypothetical protein MKK69_01100 [Methylobacterium sp. J-026]|uniref:hypothetical protein n=1 Tax=Methylobacterium sp. J-026 TaxID=2836624 RepID=UPI001FB898E8|nr:hypothetical protein [Methylobacterium sp. J-026]MCJ2132677.1 hypothetical protein [Methylobacterium sp. J-026]